MKKGTTNNPKGRPKGVEDKRNLGVKAIAERLGCDPFEVLIHFAKGDAESLGYPEERTRTGKNGETYTEYSITPEMRLQAAKEASQYLYPKRKAVEHTGEIRTGVLGQILGELNGDYSGDEGGDQEEV
jgi:hypothetical protein